MKIVHRHNLSEVEALTKLKFIANKLHQEQKGNIQSFREHWNGSKVNYEIRAKGMTFKSTVAITSDNISVDIALPFAAMIFKSLIRDQIIKNLQKSF
jgi:hypothetical protein